jgi:hypothetical protein
MPGLGKDMRSALVLINQIASVASDVDLLIANAKSSRVRGSLYMAKSILAEGRQSIIRAATQQHPWARDVLGAQLRSKNGPNCGTGAGGFQQGNDCASGKGGGKGSGGGGGSSAETQAPARRKRERKIDPGRPKFYEKSDVSWKYSEPNKQQLQDIRKAFGSNYKKRLLAVAGIPDGSNVKLQYGGSYVFVEAINAEFGTIQHRNIYIGRNGEKHRVYNSYFKVNPGNRSKGVGAEIFFAQVEAAARAKFDSISVTAARSESMNGYYTWARFGYDSTVSELTPDLRNKVRRSFPEASRVSDLMKTKAGRDWWKENGETWSGKFDLSKDSEGRKRLRNYMAAKRRAYRKQLAAAQST